MIMISLLSENMQIIQNCWILTFLSDAPLTSGSNPAPESFGWEGTLEQLMTKQIFPASIKKKSIIFVEKGFNKKR